MKQSWFGIVALVVVGSLAPVDGLGGKKKDSPTVVEDALAFAPTDRARAIEILEAAISDNPGGRDVDLLMVHAGEQRRLAGNLPQAKAWFDKVVQRGQVGPDLSASKLGLNLLKASENVTPKLRTALEETPEREALATQNADRYLILAVEAARSNDDRLVGVFSKKALSYAREDETVLDRVESTLASLAKDPENVQVEAPLAGGNALERAETAYMEGDFEAAEREANKAVSQETGETLARAQGLLKTLQSGPANRNTIVVLLPLSGKFEAAGKQVQAALQYGYGSATRTLTFVDSGSTPETAVAALEDAVATKHAIAVVGPVLAEETDLLVAAAENLHVPLLSLSQSYEKTEGHTWALQGMYTRDDQIEALLTYVTKEKAMDAFAVFGPDTPVGLSAMETFKAHAAKLGATITTSATYPGGDTDLQKNLMTASKTLGTREGNLAELRRIAEQNGGNASNVVVPPKIDFDAIFIPESMSKTPLVCAALSYEEFPMGDYVPKKGQPKVPLLGLSWWNNPELIARGNEYTRNSLFTDAFSSAALGEADPFVTAFKASVGHTPSSLEAAMADVGKLLAKAAGSQASTRPEFLEALLTASITDGVTGLTHIDRETLKADRKINIYTISKSAITQVGSVQVR
jgi:ABC-type branched-subunit amino acid transport system substrate-binding protein